MSTLILDIETVGREFDSFDEQTQKDLTRWLEDDSELDELKDGLGLNPLTGEVVSIGVLDRDKMKGVVWYQAPGEKYEDYEEDGIKYIQKSEKEILKEFWRVANEYTEFVTFNGRQFDIPFLMIRSAIHGIRPSKDLMRGRYIYQSAPDAVHIDLFDLFSFYGSLRKKGSLHLYANAFGIETSKGGEVEGKNLNSAFKNKMFKEIAYYNGKDLFVTKELYEYWNTYLRF